jgi:conjugal transfer pilus assembly protein TraV
MNRLISFSLLTTLTLSGCSIPNETFDCPAGQGVGCRSISNVNQGINNGSILKEELVEPGLAEIGVNKQFIAPVISQVSPDSLNLQEIVSQDIVLSDKSVVQRGREEHLRIWIAPHEDEENNFHEGSVVHTILRPSYWHLQQIQG